MLGPMVFKDSKYSLITMSENSIEVLGTLTFLGYTFFVFLNGVKTDLSIAFKAERKIKCLGFSMVVLPLACCLATLRTLAPDDNKSFRHMIRNKSLLLAISYSWHSFPVAHTLLSELKILNSELGRLALSATLVSDALSLTLMSIAQWMRTALVSPDPIVAFLDCGLVIAFPLIVAFVFRPVMKWIVRRTPESGQIKDLFLYTVILVLMIIPKITPFFQTFILLGTYMLGLAVPDGPPLGSALIKKLEPVVSGLLMPLFVSTCGMRIDLSKITTSNQYAKHQLVAALVTLVVKFGVSLAIPLSYNMPKRDSLALALVMISKGVIEMGTYSFMNDHQIISEDLFAMLSIIIVLLACIVPLLVKRLYDPQRRYMSYDRRTIMHSKFNEELRVIGCIHVPGDVNSIIKFMNISCPTRETPIALAILHLVKLNGRASPLFIAHSKHTTTTVSDKSYSENVVLAFNQFKRDNWEAVSLDVFTAVSPPNLMYEDICNLALNKLTSFILLPFHRRWYLNGSIESEDQAIRSLNCSILERAPCSVGILVEGRRSLIRSDSRDTSSPESSSSSSSYRIGVIFLGGSDDREALALAKRIALDTRQVSLSVVHLKATDSLGAMVSEDDEKLDDEMLRDIEEGGYISYFEEHVNDGTETSSFLRSIVHDFHLIIVGRHYNEEDPRTSGLEEWTEFKEMGIIGDMLSSTDFGGNYSVLIVQQQQLKTLSI